LRESFFARLLYRRGSVKSWFC